MIYAPITSFCAVIHVTPASSMICYMSVSLVAHPLTYPVFFVKMIGTGVL